MARSSPTSITRISSCGLRICRLGIEPPSGDLYASLGFDRSYRSGIKALVSAFLFAKRRHWDIPKSLVAGLPAGLTIAEAREALLSAHPRLAESIETGVGYSLMHTESEILLRCLETLFADGITALPMHDGLMVRRSDTKRAQLVMAEAALAITGFELPVSMRRVEGSRDEGGEDQYPGVEI